MHFLFITGVSKFAKVALFSDLNNLNDLTNYERTAALVGYTDQEVDLYLKEHIQVFANKQQEPYNQTRQTLKSSRRQQCRSVPRRRHLFLPWRTPSRRTPWPHGKWGRFPDPGRSPQRDGC